MELKENIDILENKIFNYFFDDLKSFLSGRENLCDFDFNSCLEEYLSQEDFSVYFELSEYLYFFEEELGIHPVEIYETFKENGMPYRFKEYVKYILTKPEFNLKNRLMKEGALIETMDKFSEGVIFPDDNERASEEDIEEVKKEIVQDALGSEDINLDDVDDEDLDNLLAKFVKVEEKVPAIIKYGNNKGWDKSKMIECVHSHTGMHLDESKEVLDYYMGEN